MDKSRVYIIGIGGIGTSALSRWFLCNKHKVSGSDKSESEITNELKKEGAKIFIGHKAKNISPDINLVIHSAAIGPDNPELKKAKKLGIRIQSYSEAVGEIVSQYKTIAVAGAHGKSTTTGIMASILVKNKFDPTIIIGTKLKELKNKNFRMGNSDYFLLEADEYHSAFLRYSPFAVIITNIDKEHLDYYKNLSEIKNAFLKFISNIRRDGILVLNKDDKNLFSLKNKIEKISKKHELRVYWYGLKNPQNPNLRRVLRVPGNHNVSNALGAYTLARALKISEKGAFRGISGYKGAWRRMEYRGELKVHKVHKVEVYDDYAHHPTEIKATLSAFREKFLKRKIICVFQPHQANRLKSLFKEFTGAFDAADILILLPVYKVAGRDSSGSKNIGKKLFLAIQNRIKLSSECYTLNATYYLPRPAKLRSLIKNILIHDSRFKFHDSCIVVMMGAGDIYKLTSKLVNSH